MNLQKNFIILAVATVLLLSCSRKIHPEKNNSFPATAASEPDYGNMAYWAAHPWKWDPSDSVPYPLRNSTARDSVADVFFIHPTTLVDYNDQRWNAPAEDQLINKKTDNGTILYQSSVFNEQSRVFAPRYRQAHLKSFFDSNKQSADSALEIAYKDVKEAFEYYLHYYHKGQPLIIASHSQGTLHAARLLKEFFDNKPLQQNLVCAYLIGMPAPENYFNALEPCRDSTQTGCFVSWRTYKRGYTDTTYVAKETFRAIVTNPLTWKIDTGYAASNLNKGGVLKNFNKIKKNVVDAQAHGNVLWSSKPKFFGNIFLTQKNYHIGDINLFYLNIRNNVKTRITMFLKK